jgi:hypothetical protein
VTLPPVITHNPELDKTSLEGKAQRAAAVAARTANRRGLEAFEREDWEAAARHFDEAARLDPSEPQYRRNRDRAREKSARAAPAESEFFYRLQLRLTGPEEPPRRARNEVPSPEPRYRPSGNGLVFGTGAIFGRSLPPDPTEALRREADRRLEEQKLLAGLSEAERRAFPATAEYGLLSGVAAYHDPLWDLVARVGWGDEFSEGNKSAEEQPLYASLRGRQFDRLDCHSNGAMVCLAALRREDVKATEVRLFGPQLTPDALSAWQNLIETGKLRSVRVYVNRGDPISHASYLFADLAGYVSALGLARPQVAPLSYEALAGRITHHAPALKVTLLDDCQEKNALGFDLSFSCHAMSRYQRLVDGPSPH